MGDEMIITLKWLKDQGALSNCAGVKRFKKVFGTKVKLTPKSIGIIVDEFMLVDIRWLATALIPRVTSDYTVWVALWGLAYPTARYTRFPRKGHDYNNLLGLAVFEAAEMLDNPKKYGG